MRYEGYKVLITGATSGIGLATAKRFLDEGATVIGIGRNFDKTKDFGEKFIPCVCDVTDEEQIDRAVAFVCEMFGGELDTFVNAAGLSIPGTPAEITSKEIDYGVDLLLKPALLFGKKLYPLFQKAAHGDPSIVNVSSMGNRLLVPAVMMYAVCKIAVVKATRMQAMGLKGVRCNTVSPGYIDTAIFERADGNHTYMSPEEKEAMFKSIVDQIALHRIGKPEEVASVIAFLCSEDAKYITGADILVDGGATVMMS